MDESTNNSARQRLVTLGPILGYLIFWIYNLTFIGFIAFGFGPVVFPAVIQGVRAGIIPVFYAVYGGILISIPILAAILGATLLRKHLDKLFLLGYGIEGPLMLILAVRFFGLGQTTLPIKIIMGVAAIGLATLLWHILDPHAEERVESAGLLKSIGLACLVAIGLYASIWILFYAAPLVRFMWDGLLDVIYDIPAFWEMIWRDLRSALRDGIQFLFILVFGGTILLFSSILFVLIPLIVPWLYAKTWWIGNKGIGQLRAAMILVTVFLVIGLSLYITDEQPQTEAFALLETVPQNAAEARELLDQQDTIRDGLLNSYLARTRYLSALNELDHVRWMYEDAFGRVRRPRTEENRYQPYQIREDYTGGLLAQQRVELIARPFLYQPVNEIETPESSNLRWASGSALRSEPEEAAELYEKFFDELITEGEKEEVVRAVRTTWEPARAQDAWQAVDDREVYLKQQNLAHLNLNHGVHEFELHEVYSNQTAIRQEVVYFFSLPESAVITGVWLGDENGKQFEYRVSPRGAAQQVYQEQVRRNIDPALVEQIGPQQYRVRIFPIDPLSEVWEPNSSSLAPELEPGDDMHFWLKWQVLEQDGQIPMPQLSTLRNVYWDDETAVVYPAGLTHDQDRWLPASMAASDPVQPDHVVTFDDGRTVVAQASNLTIPELPVNLTFAAVLDRSFSMGEHADEVKAVLDDLFEISPRTDLYLTASEFSGREPSLIKLIEMTDDELVYFGGQNSAEIMQQFADLNNGTEYDAIFVISDDGTFSTSANETDTVAVPNAPVWMVHLGGIFPNGYDDNTLEILQASGGGAVVSVDDAINNLAVSWDNPESILADGFIWTTYPAGAVVELPEGTVTHALTEPFAKNAARQLILAEMRANKGSITDVALLDGLHEIAVTQEIVTPFSSMIVLVNSAQEARLDQLEQKDDRFEREVEAVGETAPGPTVTGVPEPEEWLLIILSAGMLLWYFWKRRQQANPIMSF